MQNILIMKKVDIIYSGWVSAPNGASTFVREMKDSISIFSQYGIDLSVFSKDLFIAYPHRRKDKLRQKMSLKSLLISLVQYSILGTFVLLKRLYLYHSKYIVKRYLDMTKEMPDILYFQEVFTCYYFLKYRTDKNSKIYLTLHSEGDFWGMLYLQFPQFKKRIFASFRKKVENAILLQVHYIGFVANTPRINFCQRYSFPHERTFFVYNGIPDIKRDVNYFLDKKKLDNKINLICVGTLCDRKNQYGILKALKLLPGEVQKEYTLTLVGDGEDRKKLEQYSQQLLVEVRFIGSSNIVDEYLHSADCFILFSKKEGLPIAIIEAMREGLPIISTSIAGIPELINDGENGYLIELDELKLSNLLLKIAVERPNLRHMGEASRKLFNEKFTKEQMILSYSKIMKK